MARYLSPEWVESFDAALGAVDLHDAIEEAGADSLLVADGTFSVAQVVDDAPEGTVRTVLTVADGHAHLALDPDGSASARANVTLVLGYADAFALAQGELEPADALADGRIRVRGDLSALVAVQDILAETAARLGTILQDLTDPEEQAAE